jgi:ABC-type antimicrobial peptide transport system permease subunit
MGVSRFGVFYMVFLRAVFIGMLAAGVTVGVGLLAALFMNWQPAGQFDWARWKPVIHVVIEPLDMLIVVLGALACCMFGSVIPARKASAVDPFDAIVEGRFR